MSGLLFLTSSDFSSQQGQRGNIVCNNIRGISLILLYSPKCEHSQKLFPIFKRLPGTINGCQFGIINVTQETDIIRLSKNSVAPIEYVPLIILYVNGKPFIRYDGPHMETDIRNFLIDVTSKLQAKEKFSDNNKKEGNNKQGKDIPPYTVGVPLCGEDEIGYLEFDEAYT